MGRVVMNGPPECPSDRDWCIACLMQAKQRQWEAYQDRIKAGYDASGDKTSYVEFPAALLAEMRPGYYTAVCGDFPHLGIVDGLCWDHVAGINPAEVPSSPIVPGTVAAPAGLMRRNGRS